MEQRTLQRAEEVAEILGIGRWKTYDMITRGQLPTLRIGRLVRVPRTALEQWITANTSGAGSPDGEVA